MNRSRTLVVAGLVAIVLAACGSSSASPSASQAASVAPSESAAESPGIGLPSFSAGVVAELEALIPDEIGGATMQKFSMRGDQFLASGQEDPTTARFLEELGVSPNDVSIAFGFGFAADFTSGAAMFVFRAEGASEDRLLQVFKDSMDEDRDIPLEWTTVTIAGHEVESATDADADDQAMFLYAKGELLYFVSTTDPAAAEEVIAGLP
jgi:hypothetical protein